MIKPRAIAKGDTLGLIAPSSPVHKNGQLEEGIKILENQGYKVVVGESCRCKYGYLSGDDNIRANDINKMFSDKNIDAIFCLRGGYGAPRILAKLDYEMIKKSPKLFMGYSDITAIHLALNQECELITFHGPMVASDMIEGFDDFTRKGFLKAITSTKPMGIVENPLGIDIKSLVGGEARGKIVGGNLSLLVALMGTPYEINTKGKILFLEDIGEYTYSIDRMLTQLKLARKLEECVGIILGDFNNCMPQYEELGLTLMEVFKDIIVSMNKPTVYNLMAGHSSPKITLPLGVEALLDGDNGILKIVESALVEGCVAR